MGKGTALGGIEGYNPAKTMTPFDGPLTSKIHEGKKKTFIDDELKVKAFVPDAKYEINGYDWTSAKKPNFNKEFRHTMYSEAERLTKKFPKPTPSTYKLKHGLVEPGLLGAYSLKGKRDDTSFLANPIFNGHNSPRFHDKKHELVENRIKSMTFNKAINETLDKIPTFLRAKKATHLISPASHNPLESLKSACLPNQTFYMRKGSPKSHVDQEIKRTKGNPGVGHYSIKNIENAYNKITLGASKGWK
jgi:hypothetical protein